MNKLHFTKVSGNNQGDIFLFALSTCIWCKKTKQFLDNKGVEYNYVFVDLLNEDEKKEVREMLKQWNPDVSYPTIVFNESSCIVGFDEEKVEKELANG